MATPRRIERLQKQILRAIARIVLYEMHDPRGVGKKITFTRVKLSRDLTFATVFYSVLGTDGEQRMVAGFLDHAKSRIRQELGPELSTRTLPLLDFEYDPSIAGQAALMQTLNELRQDWTEGDEQGAERDARDSPSSSSGSHQAQATSTPGTPEAPEAPEAVDPHAHATPGLADNGQIEVNQPPSDTAGEGSSDRDEGPPEPIA